MATFYKQGNTIKFDGYKGIIFSITETYRKNVIVLKISELPKPNPFPGKKVEYIGLFEYPDGHLEFMSVIED